MMGHHRGSRGFATACATVLAVLALSACGGNSPTAPRPTTTSTTLAPTSVTFTTDASNPGTDAIALSMTAATATEFTLVLTATEVTDLYGYGIDIVFDPTLVMFDSADAGTFFEGEGITVITQVTEEPEGTLVIGQSRAGAVAGVNGSGTLLHLNFKSVAAGTSPFTTVNGGAFDSTGAALATLFFGGSATIPPQVAR